MVLNFAVCNPPKNWFCSFKNRFPSLNLQLQYALDVDLVTQAHVHTCVTHTHVHTYGHVLVLLSRRLVRTAAEDDFVAMKNVSYFLNA